MEECDKGTHYMKTNDVIDSNENYKTQKCNLIPFDIKLDNKLKVKKSQLLSTDDWENYQKELIRMCFEYWEENETQSHEVKNSIQSDLEISDSESEIKMPSSLFVAEKNKHRNFDFKTKEKHNNTRMIDELQKNKYIEVNNHYLKSKQKDDPVIQRLSKSIIANINWKNNGNCSKRVDVENKRTKKKKSKKFTFYKHTSKHAKQKNKLQSFTIDRSTTSSCTLDDLWKYKKWLDSVEKINKQSPANIDFTNDNTEEHSDKINFDEKNNDDFMNSIDTDPKQMEHKVRKLIKSLKKKDRLFTSIGVNEPTTKCGSSNKLKCFFKSAFRGNQNELDLQLLNDYTKYINQKLKTWQTLLHYLEDIKQKECYKIKTINPLEDTIKYRFSEKNDHVNHKNKVLTDDNYDDQNCKFVDFAENSNEIVKQKRKFFKLLHYKTKSNIDMRTTVKQMENRNNSVDDVRENDHHRGWPTWMSNDTTMMTDINTNQLKYGTNQTKNGSNFMNKVNGNRKSSSVRIRRSLSDTELLSTIKSSSYYMHRGRTAVTMGNGTTTKIRMATTADEKYCRCYDSSTRSSSSRRSRSSRSMSLSMGTCSRSSSSSSSSNNRNYDTINKDHRHGLCSEERHECFQTAVARLEYVGSTFKEQFRLAGLKTLCKVDVLAGFGHSAEAVDLFVTALQYSKNPELMIRKAEAAYDWKFFCHLSMWRHSYKD